LRLSISLHKAAEHTHAICGISFDREKSVMSKDVEAYLEANNIKFNPFTYTSSKVKFAKSGILIVKDEVAKLERYHREVAKSGG